MLEAIVASIDDANLLLQPPKRWVLVNGQIIQGRRSKTSTTVGPGTWPTQRLDRLCLDQAVPQTS